MKKFFAILIVFAMVFTACENPSTGDKGTAITTLVINNMSGYPLYNVEYSSVDFGTIDSGKDVTNEVSGGTKYIFFSLQTVNGKIRCRTEEFTCVEGEKNEKNIVNNTLITTVVTEREDRLIDLFNILNNESANPKIKILHENYPVTSGTTIPLYDIGKGQKQTITLKIVNEGEHDLQITGTKPQISGANAAQVAAGNYSSVRLAYSEAITLKLDFTPSVSGDNSFTVTVISNDQENGIFSIDVTANVKNTWQRLYGSSGARYGIYRAISNGQGGIYAGGYTSNNTAALFNIDGNGNIQNTFTFYSSLNGTVGPVGIGSEYNNYFAVLEGFDGITDSYRILKTNNPTTKPDINNQSYIIFYEKPVLVQPMGIIKNGNYYFVAGGAEFYNSLRATIRTKGVFIERLNSDLLYDKSMMLTIDSNDVVSQSFGVTGTAILSNGDILLYGKAIRNGRDVAFAAAVNVSAVNAGSWNVRWSNYYEISGKSSKFHNHFMDSSNIVLLGQCDDGGFVVKFPTNVTTAAAAKPAGWPKVITGIYGAFTGGLSISDGSGYLFVGSVGWGGGTGPYGGEDAWIVKTDLNITNKTWEKFFGGTGNDWCMAVIEQSDGFLIGGAAQSPVVAGQQRTGTEDIYLLKINKDGTMD